MHPLDDCRLKIARAKEQFESLRAEIIEFDKANPYVLNIEIDPETGGEIVKCANPPAFPRRWGVLVGELAHNLRSSLDYLVAVLIQQGGRNPNRDSAFPIAKTATRYLRKNKRGVTYRDRVLRGLSPEMKKRIDALQPFNRGDLAYADMLLGLADLSNRDKHRELHPAYAWITTPSRAFSFPTDDELKTSSCGYLAMGDSQWAQSSSTAGVGRCRWSCTRTCKWSGRPAWKWSSGSSRASSWDSKTWPG